MAYDSDHGGVLSVEAAPGYEGTRPSADSGDRSPVSRRITPQPGASPAAARGDLRRRSPAQPPSVAHAVIK
jgi:hypothetical protein